MMRKNPIPVGRYWIYIQKPSADVWERWLAINKDIVSVERKDESGALWPFIKANETFYIFNVKEPTIWPRGVGFANTAGPQVTSPEDTVQRPPPPTVTDILTDMANTASEAAGTAVTGLLILGALWWYSQRGRR
jgi:hypothetical protein